MRPALNALPTLPAAPLRATDEACPTWAWISFGTLLAAAVFSIQIYWTHNTFRECVTWGQALYWGLGDWLEWALQFPLIAWMCRRYTFTPGKWAWSALIFVLGAVLTLIAHPAFCAAAAVLQAWYLGEQVSFAAVYLYELEGRTPVNLTAYFLLIAVWYAWSHHARSLRRERQLGELRRELVEAQLRALRMQLNPHFLFNTLNTISSLMLEDVQAANRMVSRLGTLLRSTLTEDFNQEISLGREVALTREYLEIESVRFGPRLRLEIAAPPDTEGAAVPPFILQPLVENAIKHAVARNVNGGVIAVRAAREEGRLRLEVADTGAGTRRERIVVERKESVGLRNVRSRLEGYYGNNQSLVLSNNAHGGTTARIMLPYRSVTP